MIRTLAALCSALVLVACERASTPPQTPSRPGSITSNVLFDDYAGSASCERCHAETSRRYARSPMHRMTRSIDDTEVRAPFDGRVFRFKGDVATMHQVESRRYLELVTRDAGRQLFRLTEVIGGRYREDFVGYEVTGTAPNAPPRFERSRRLVMPVSWLNASGEWRYKGYSVQVPERPRMTAGPRWRRTCIFCHNTVPYLSTALDDLGGPSAPVFQGTTPATRLPADRRLAHRVLDPGALRDALRAELERLGAREAASELPHEPRPMLESAIRATGRSFDAQHLVELGIGCESCHGGSREHVRDPHTLPSFVPTSKLFAVSTARGSPGDAEAVNHACARCHSVLFSRYPHTWEGGRRADHTGGSTINSGEARDFLLGSCSRAMKCTTCHDPHAQDDREALHALATPAGNRVCTPCHAKLSTAPALARHSHHDPTQAGGSCVACHMPRKNTGLGFELTRYHRIGSPTDTRRVQGDRPLECALCHPDRSVDSLVTTMERWWRRSYERSALRRLYGDDLAVSPLVATLARGLPHEQTVAIAVLGASGDRRHAPALVEQLGNPLPLTRYYAREALARLLGERPPLDMSLEGAELVAAGRAWLVQRQRALQER